MDYIERRNLIACLREQFKINWHGHHGVTHWARVRANGLMVAMEFGSNPHVVELFAWFHDSRRVNEYEDNRQARIV